MLLNKQLCFFFSCLLLCMTCLTINAQKLIIGFYNCENFYDTVHQRQVIDEEFLPNSAKHYSSRLFEKKLAHIAGNIYALSKLEHLEGLAFIGLAEIENRKVLEQVIAHPIIAKYHYKIIHFDSPDPRGIDVALLYAPSHFVPYQYKPIPLTQGPHTSDFPTRDILYVKGQLDHLWVHVFVNHWPSRRGGQAASSSRRNWASQVLKHQIDSILLVDPGSTILVMGDFNDNPTDKSLLALSLFNPFLEHFYKGDGSLAFGDSWHLFDQILTSKNLKGDNSDLSIYKSIIYKNDSLLEKSGLYKGYPKRTWMGDQFNNGYSDHFPVALILSLKKAENPLK